MDKPRYNIPQLFAESVFEHADRPALLFAGKGTVSYAELDRISNRLARFLSSAGVKPGSRVCLCSEKSLLPYATILASLKLGAVYFAVDPRNPAARTEKIFAQCSPTAVVTDTDLEFPVSAESIHRFAPSWNDLAECAAFNDGPIDSSAVDGSMPAYIMFTSGSTGSPKGAVISHDNLVHFAEWAGIEYRFTPEDRHTHLNPIYFDNSVFDIYSTFLTGGCLVPFEASVMNDPGAIVDRLRETACTTWFSVPSLLMYLQVMKVVSRDSFASLTRIIFGGEGFPKVKLKELFDEVGGSTGLYNVYGPTECTCICSSHLVTEEDFRDMDGLPTLGHLIPNFRGYVLDDDQEVERGELGELCLGGPCVGLGYYNQPEQTSKAFVQNPLNPSFREILYRTGDLVRQDPASGYYSFVGRKDLQIKHQGYRIELEEIQNAFISLDGVDEAVVLHRKSGGSSRLIAVVASTAGLDPKNLKRDVAALIPQYMLPEKILVMSHLPKNANGKTDRQRLADEIASG